ERSIGLCQTIDAYVHTSLAPQLRMSRARERRVLCLISTAELGSIIGRETQRLAAVRDLEESADTLRARAQGWVLARPLTTVSTMCGGAIATTYRRFTPRPW